MPKLEDIRKWLQEGRPIEGLPEHWKEQQERDEMFESEFQEAIEMKRGVNVGKVRDKIDHRNFSPSIDGRDAVLNFGKFKGRTVSSLVSERDGRSYLRWILGQEFGKELKEIVQRCLEEGEP